jgi:hypothetical protein
MSVGLWRDLCQLAWSWYSHDRIRASPAEGRFLRIRPGDLLTHGGVDAIVVDRSISEGSAGLCIQLTCQVETGIGELHLTATDPETLRLTWIEAGHCREIAAADVEIWPRTKNAGNEPSQCSMEQ